MPFLRSSDSKNESLTAEILPVYVPNGDSLAFDYYNTLEKELPIKAVKLPTEITAEYVKSINNQPGILSLKLEVENNEVKGVPFVVPGGRFNEMYGWDSYFEAVGLICDGNSLDDVYSSINSMLENKKYLNLGKNAKEFVNKFQWSKIIEEYKKILN